MHTTIRLAFTHNSVPTNTHRHVHKYIHSLMHIAFCAYTHRHRPPPTTAIPLYTWSNVYTWGYPQYIFMHKTCIHTLPSTHTISSFTHVIIYTNIPLIRCGPTGLSTDDMYSKHTHRHTHNPKCWRIHMGFNTQTNSYIYMTDTPTQRHVHT